MTYTATILVDSSIFCKCEDFLGLVSFRSAEHFLVIMCLVLVIVFFFLI